jgi:hypothetical protein
MAAMTLGCEVKVSEGEAGSNVASNDGKSTKLAPPAADPFLVDEPVVGGVGVGVLVVMLLSNLCSIFVTHGDGGGDAYALVQLALNDPLDKLDLCRISDDLLVLLKLVEDGDGFTFGRGDESLVLSSRSLSPSTATASAGP